MPFFTIGLGLKMVGFTQSEWNLSLFIFFLRQDLFQEIIMTIDQFHAYTFSSIAYI